MFTTKEVYQLNYLRKHYYDLNGRYGEIFDSTFLDCVRNSPEDFDECLKNAKDETDDYIKFENEDHSDHGQYEDSYSDEDLNLIALANKQTLM